MTLGRYEKVVFHLHGALVRLLRQPGIGKRLEERGRAKGKFQICQMHAETDY